MKGSCPADRRFPLGERSNAHLYCMKKITKIRPSTAGHGSILKGKVWVQFATLRWLYMGLRALKHSKSYESSLIFMLRHDVSSSVTESIVNKHTQIL